MGAEWLVPGRDLERADELSRRLGLTPVGAHLLVRLGYTEVEAAQSFLDPSLRELLEPAGLPDIDAAVERIGRAIDAEERILVFGDYDVDGSTGAAILHEVLGQLGARVEVHIPDREEGYGLNQPRLERAAQEGIAVVISVDNGISAFAEAELLRERGLDLIIVDHHTFGETLPHAVARVHPGLPESRYANPHLCGAGVAFKVAWAVAAARSSSGRPGPRMRELLLECLALVALGTVADVVPLRGENRILVRYGLRALGGTRWAGLQALLRISRVDETPSAMDVAFRLAPRLNAAGRMGRAARAFQLLIARDPDEAQRLAEELDAENKRRRALQKRVFEEAREQVREVYGEPARAAGIMCWSEGWPHGVVGIVAAKLCETFQRPTLVASIEGSSSKGSGRSWGGVDLLASLEEARPICTRLGGHQAAVGFTVATERLSELREAFAQGVQASLGLDPGAEPREMRARLEGYEVEADVQVELGELSGELLQELRRFGPFGAGNPEPVFAARELRLAGEPRLMGQTGQHVSFHVRQGDQVLRTVAFGRPELWDELRTRARRGPAGPATFELAFHPRLNRWRGRTSLELELKAIRFD